MKYFLGITKQPLWYHSLHFKHWITGSPSSGSLQYKIQASVPYVCEHLLFVHQISVEKMSFPQYLGMTTNGITILVGDMIFELGFHRNKEWYKTTAQICSNHSLHRPLDIAIFYRNIFSSAVYYRNNIFLVVEDSFKCRLPYTLTQFGAQTTNDIVTQ